MLQTAATDGYVSNYQGWRMSLGGKRFKILDVELFNVIDFSGDKIGQAAVFKQYELEDGTVIQVTSEPWQLPKVYHPPSEDEVSAAEIAVAQQGDVVRNLKEIQGLGNQVGTLINA